MPESLIDSKEKKNKLNDDDDFVSMGTVLCKKVNIKIAIGLFILGMIIFSDLFISILEKISKSYVEGLNTTTKGTVVQLLLLCIGYIIIDLIVQSEYL